MMLTVDKSKCTGCRFCMLICSLSHENFINPEYSRIWIDRPSLELDEPVVCRQCEDPECVKACPEGALHQLESGAIGVDEMRCKKKGKCVKDCQFDAIRISPLKDAAIVCDLCGEDEPQCVKYCPVNAIEVEE